MPCSRGIGANPALQALETGGHSPVPSRRLDEPKILRCGNFGGEKELISSVVWQGFLNTLVLRSTRLHNGSPAQALSLTNHIFLSMHEWNTRDC